MIEVRGLKKTFDGFAALDGADLSVPRGAVYGLVGPNGAGKTTLLRHLTGVYHQDSGSVTFDGEEVWENAGVKARIASIPDDWFYFMQAGLRDMMRFYRGLYPKFDQERFEKLREVFALDEKRPLRLLLCKQAAKNFHTICKKETALKRVLSNLLSAVSLLRFKAVFSCGFRVPPGSGLYQSCAAGSVCIPAGQKYCSPRPRKSCPADRKTPGLPSRCIGHRW